MPLHDGADEEFATTTTGLPIQNSTATAKAYRGLAAMGTGAAITATPASALNRARTLLGNELLKLKLRLRQNQLLPLRAMSRAPTGRRCLGGVAAFTR